MAGEVSVKKAPETTIEIANIATPAVLLTPKRAHIIALERTPHGMKAARKVRQKQGNTRMDMLTI